jgi:hypothetical protein
VTRQARRSPEIAPEGIFCIVHDLAQLVVRVTTVGSPSSGDDPRRHISRSTEALITATRKEMIISAGQGPTDYAEQDPLGDLDADDLRRDSGLIRYVHPVTWPGRKVIYIYNSVRQDKPQVIVYPLDVFFERETAEAATMLREGMSREAIRNWLDTHVDQVFGDWE